MLARLSIRDIVLIDRLDLELACGLSVLTGETGAGKSILLDAFALALGARGDASLVRHGCAQGQVTAAFDIDRRHPVSRPAQGQRHCRGRRTDPAPRAACRRAHPRLRQRPAGERRRCCGRSAPGWWKSTASTTIALWSMPPRIGGCSTPMPVSRPMPHASRRCGRRGAHAEQAVAAHRAEVERARARGRLAAPCGRGTHSARPAADRGNRTRRTPRDADAKREGRRGLARCRMRRFAGAPFADAGAVDGAAAAGAARRAGAGADRRAGRRRSMPRSPRSTRRAASSNRRCARPITIRASSRISRSACSPCARRRANINARSTILPLAPSVSPPISL